MPPICPLYRSGRAMSSKGSDEGSVGCIPTCPRSAPYIGPGGPCHLKGVRRLVLAVYRHAPICPLYRSGRAMSSKGSDEVCVDCIPTCPRSAPYIGPGGPCHLKGVTRLVLTVY